MQLLKVLRTVEVAASGKKYAKAGVPEMAIKDALDKLKFFQDTDSYKSVQLVSDLVESNMSGALGGKVPSTKSTLKKFESAWSKINFEDLDQDAMPPQKIIASRKEFEKMYKDFSKMYESDKSDAVMQLYSQITKRISDDLKSFENDGDDVEDYDGPDHSGPPTKKKTRLPAAKKAKLSGGGYDGTDPDDPDSGNEGDTSGTSNPKQQGGKKLIGKTKLDNKLLSMIQSAIEDDADSPKNVKLYEKVIQSYNKKQDIGALIATLTVGMKRVKDSPSVQALEKFIAKNYGISSYGEKGEHSGNGEGYNVAQHADSEKGFQSATDGQWHGTAAKAVNAEIDHHRGRQQNNELQSDLDNKPPLNSKGKEIDAMSKSDYASSVESIFKITKQMSNNDLKMYEAYSNIEKHIMDNSDFMTKYAALSDSIVKVARGRNGAEGSKAAQKVVRKAKKALDTMREAMAAISDNIHTVSDSIEAFNTLKEELAALQSQYN
jgi:hypothetical protein